MSLTFEQVCQLIDDMHLDDLDIEITYNGLGFTVGHADSSPWVEDIGSSYEVPDNAGGDGSIAFNAGPWTAYQYDAHYVTPRRDNYERQLADLVGGQLRAVIIGVTAVEDAWVFGIQTRA